MSESGVEHTVRTIVEDRFLKGSRTLFTASTDLLAAGICDSLGLMELATEIEARFPTVRVDDQEITASNFASIDRIVEYLRSKGVS